MLIHVWRETSCAITKHYDVCHPGASKYFCRTGEVKMTGVGLAPFRIHLSGAAVLVTLLLHSCS